MRILLAIALILAATPTYAACEPMRPSSWGDESLAQAAHAVCLQTELARRSIENQRLAQLRAEYELKLTLLRIRLQQLQVPPLPPIVPAF